MALRCGLTHEQADVLRPSEILDAWDAWLWRRSREADLLAVATCFVAGAWGARMKPRDVTRCIGGYIEADDEERE